MSSYVPSSYETSSVEQYLGSFWNIKLEHIDKSNFYSCDNSFNYNKIYFIYDFFVSNPTRLAIRPLACFCTFCFERDWHHC
jgi:hypothetical protein